MPFTILRGGRVLEGALGGTIEACLATALPRLIEGGFLVLHEVHRRRPEPAASASTRCSPKPGYLRGRSCWHGS
jgi:hypothetical protein